MAKFSLLEGAAPGTPAANYVALYAKTDSRMYTKGDDGVEVALQAFMDVGTRMLFQQTAAPTGWTKETSATYNDAALRFQTGTVTTGGANGFIATMNAAGTTATDGSGTSGGFTLTTAEIPSHAHQQQAFTTNNIATAIAQTASSPNSTPTATAIPSTQATGGGGSHAHSTPAHAHTLNSFALKFVDCIICTKD